MELIKNYQIYAVIVAGGKGLRMGSAIRKQYLKISGIPILAHTLSRFINFDLFNNFTLFKSMKSICKIVLVIPDEEANYSEAKYCLENIILPYGFEGKVSMVSGGLERQQSVMNGLKKVLELDRLENQNKNFDCLEISNKDFDCSETSNKDFDCSKTSNKIVLIHDGVRPFVDNEIIIRCIEGAIKHGACIPVIPVVDTLKQMDSDGFVAGVVDRQNLYHVQTPQAFQLDLIINAYEHAILSDFSGNLSGNLSDFSATDFSDFSGNDFLATDDASLVENMGKKVFMTPGSKKNIKITTQDDLLLAEYMMLKNI